jgi:hypothetical protein
MRIILLSHGGMISFFIEFFVETVATGKIEES